jgi:hypothetical protein
MVKRKDWDPQYSNDKHLKPKVPASASKSKPKPASLPPIPSESELKAKNDLFAQKVVNPSNSGDTKGTDAKKGDKSERPSREDGTGGRSQRRHSPDGGRSKSRNRYDPKNGSRDGGSV